MSLIGYAYAFLLNNLNSKLQLPASELNSSSKKAQLPTSELDSPSKKVQLPTSELQPSGFYSYFQVNRPRGRGARPCAPSTGMVQIPENS
ncbi:hypothetical protein NSTCB13_04379 [Nostoc sp. DSM 114160]|jgi:hypothetical protein